MSTATPFQYTTRLAPGEIRLLSFIPPTTSDPSLPLSFTLQTTTLSPSPPPEPPTTPTPYLALSYVWGAETNPLPIQIDNHPFPVTPNLHSALTHLAKNELLTHPVWADAVCINQSDETEKLGQIARMADVYRQAKQVLVFLGESDARTDAVVRQMERIGGGVLAGGAMIFREPDLAKWPGFDGCEERQRKIGVRMALERIMDRERGGIVFGKPGLDGNAALDLFHRPWFTRAWVIQEICVPPDREGAVTFACGDARISWERLWAAHLFFALWILREGKAVGEAKGVMKTLFGLGLFIRRTGMIPRPFSARAAQTLGVRKKHLQGDLNRSLKGLLKTLYVADSGNPLGCREPEDKIRAIRGLASDGQLLDGILTPGQSWQHICTSLARHFYHQRNLDLLSLCRCRSPTLPSWATDWTQQQRPPWLGYKTSDSSQLFDAAKGTDVQLYDDETGNTVLSLRGFTVDTIQEVGSEWASNLDDDFNWESARLRIVEIDRFLSLSKLYSSVEKSAARWRILIADRVGNDLQTHVRATTTPVAEESFAKMEPIAKAFSPISSGSLGAWYLSYRNTLMTLWSSRPFLSSRGYIGLCPGPAAEGDTVFIPSGSHCPYVIRRSELVVSSDSQVPSTQVTGDVNGEVWQLLGEAYVHGVMDGELDLGNQDADARKFRLV